MMKPRSIAYFFKESLISLKRNGWMSLASISTVAISLFVFGIFYLLVLNVNHVATSIESSLEIKAFLHVETPAERVEEIKKSIEAYPTVEEVILVSKDEALESLKEQFGQEHDLVGALEGENPLNDSFTIKVKSVDDVIPVAESLEGMEHFEKVRYGQGVVEKLMAVINWVRLLGVGAMSLLALAAVVLIAITIKLTVFARKKEILVMKYVGATDWFIRWPFLLEGMFLGLIGSLVAVGCLFWLYSTLLDNVQVTLSFIQLIRDPNLLLQINLGLMAAGTALGAVGSGVAVRKFLKV